VITLRDGAPEDIEDVLRFWRLAGTVPTSTDDASALRLLLAHPSSVLLLAFESAELVGTVIAGFDGWRGGVYRLAVHRGKRRHGIGEALVAEAVRRLDALGARRVAAVARADEAQAVAFWESGAGEGFRRGPACIRYVRG
jgi:ribosomal protein S18 acetylase RimI-like enzyme